MSCSLSLPHLGLACLDDLKHALVREDAFALVVELEVDVFTLLLYELLEVVSENLLSLCAHLVLLLDRAFLLQGLLDTLQLLLKHPISCKGLLCQLACEHRVQTWLLLL